ncbi:helix-turn-helix transcriptional regulator [Actinomycetospora lutea]|uniref:helix-turn-helix domain-containing protein n=1 Tax=Actinomycetospora lutea TaxID=663604 RepID=UPI002365CDAC|nr:helix-turn-helix transcriptional regulator [Actinomycetospora lutea]MDD7937499.1 helix-turn-helix transcriptional regulator [Actinomycetospora lutea]
MAEQEHTEPEGTGPTARRIILGAQLRRLRERAGVARSDAAWSIRGSDSKMSRLEAGKVGFKERDVADLLTMYGITEDSERELLLDMTRRSNEPGWWQPYGDVLPDWFEDYVGLETSASRVQTYELMFVPGLLQTEDYARAIITSGHPDRATADDERRLTVRMRRQQMLGRRDSPTVWAILDESVLHRPIGGHAVLVGQIERLLEVAALPNVVIQVLPFALSGYAAESTFSILRFSEPELPDLVYQEHLTHATYLDKRPEVEQYSRVMDRVAVDALTPDETRQYLTKLAAER